MTSESLSYTPRRRIDVQNRILAICVFAVYRMCNVFIDPVAAKTTLTSRVHVQGALGDVVYIRMLPNTSGASALLLRSQAAVTWVSTADRLDSFPFG